MNVLTDSTLIFLSGLLTKLAYFQNFIGFIFLFAFFYQLVINRHQVISKISLLFRLFLASCFCFIATDLIIFAIELPINLMDEFLGVKNDNLFLFNQDHKVFTGLLIVFSILITLSFPLWYIVVNGQGYERIDSLIPIKNNTELAEVIVLKEDINDLIMSIDDYLILDCFYLKNNDKKMIAIKKIKNDCVNIKRILDKEESINIIIDQNLDIVSSVNQLINNFKEVKLA